MSDDGHSTQRTRRLNALRGFVATENASDLILLAATVVARVGEHTLAEFL